MDSAAWGGLRQNGPPPLDARPPPLTLEMSVQRSFVPRCGVFFSGRFDGAFMERAIRAVAAEVWRRAPFIRVLIVEGESEDGVAYGRLTMRYLRQMELMVAFAFENYGQCAGNPCCTYGEVNYCMENRGTAHCLPLKLYSSRKKKDWPPAPADYDGGEEGAAQNKFFFRADLAYEEFLIDDSAAKLEASKVAMADCIIGRYLQMHPELRGLDDRQAQKLLEGEPTIPARLEMACRRGVFLSGRFDSALKERAMRSVARQVRIMAPFVEVLVVDSLSAQGFEYLELTTSFLARMELMVPFVFDDYGQCTGNPYCTLREAVYCLEHEGEVECLPLKLYCTERWPPAQQNELFFGTELPYRKFPIHSEAELLQSKVAMADCIIDRYLQMHPELRCHRAR